MAIVTTVLVCGVAVAACGGSSNASSSKPSESSESSSSESSAASSSAAGEEGSGEPVSVVLSNNYMGNTWRPQMVNAAKIVSSRLGASKVKLEVKISPEPTPTSQIASLQQIIRTKPQAIVMDAASPTALNPTVQQACSAGIVVVSFDQYVTAPCAYKLPESYTNQGSDMGNWLGTVLHGKGEVILDEGLPGAALSDTFYKTWVKLFKEKYPGIKVVGSYKSEFSDGPQAQAIGQLLSQNPNITGVLSDYSCTSIFTAFEKAGKKPGAIACNADNGGAIKCQETKTACFLYGAPSWVGGLAVQKAVEIVDKEVEQPKEEVFWETNWVSTAGNVKFPHKQKVEVLTPEKNYYPKASKELILSLTFGNYEITPEEVLGNG